MMNITRLTALILLLLQVCLYSDERLIIDLAVKEGPVTYRASGFLFGFTPTVPDDKYFNELKPQLVRAGNYPEQQGSHAFDIYERTTAQGAEVQILMGDAWGPANYDIDYWPGDGGDWTRWEELVRDLLEEAGDREFQWDIWNEPDIGFWKRSFEQYLEMWKVAHDIIREVKPGEPIVGPGPANFNFGFLQNFLLWARDNDALPDILTWHEFVSSHNMENNVAITKEWMADNNIEIPVIQINEYVRFDEQYHPGILVDYFAAFERTKVAGGCHACWPDQGVSNCWSNTLNGLLTVNERLPRSTWWVYRSYADLSGNMLGVTPTENLDGVASLNDSTRVIKVLLGKRGGEGSSTLQIDNFSTVTFEGDNNLIEVRAERIPNNGTEALAERVLEFEEELTPANGTLEIDLPNFGSSDAYLVTFTMPKITPAGSPVNSAEFHTVQYDRWTGIMNLKLNPGAGLLKVWHPDGSLVNQLEFSSATGNVSWQVKDKNGFALNAGLYMYSIVSNDAQFKGKILID